MLIATYKYGWEEFFDKKDYEVAEDEDENEAKTPSAVFMQQQVAIFKDESKQISESDEPATPPSTRPFISISYTSPTKSNWEMGCTARFAIIFIALPLLASALSLPLFMR